jgi:hypothetical protein
MNATPTPRATTWGRMPHAHHRGGGSIRADDPKAPAHINSPAQVPIRRREVSR